MGYLVQQGGFWRVSMGVPAALQGILGHARLVRGLGTRSLEVAHVLKVEPIAEFKRRIAEAALAAGPIQPGRSAAREAAAIAKARAIIAKTEPGRLRAFEVEVSRHNEPSIQAAALVLSGPENRGEMVHRLRSVSAGEITPIAKHHPEFKGGLDVKSRSLLDDDRVMQGLVAWCHATRTPPLVESFDSVTATRMARETFTGLSKASVVKYVSRLGLYWDFLIAKGAATQNPFRGLEKLDLHFPEQVELRPFTDDEVSLLLADCPEPGLRDLMPIAALTGARLDVICDLRVGDCRDGFFTFKAQRREPGRRDVPIHPDLADIVDSRTQGRKDDEWLFPEYPVPPSRSSRPRSAYASKRFTKYRRNLGIGEPRDDSGRVETNRGEVNFESFRRWFISQAQDVPQPHGTLACVLGAPSAGRPLDRHGPPERMQAARNLVESIRLPALAHGISPGPGPS